MENKLTVFQLCKLLKAGTYITLVKKGWDVMRGVITEVDNDNKQLTINNNDTVNFEDVKSFDTLTSE